ncbi:MAG: choice-of-anchor M domain-containing protein, partial [Microbacteriaceae bacterium]
IGQIPLTQQAQVPWLGWNTQHPTIAGKTQGPVTLTLDSLDGPGDMAVYSMDSWGGLGDRFFGTVSGFPRSTSIAVGASGVHVHGVWAFTEPGTYRAAMSFSTTIGGAEQKANTVLTFFVGDGDPSQAAGEHDVTTVVGQTPDGKPCDLSLAETGSRDRWVIETGAIAVALFALGIAFLGAASLRPRRFVTQR